MDKYDDRLILEFYTTKVPDKVITKEYRDSIKGIRIGQYRPNRVRVKHAGPDLDLSAVEKFESECLFNVKDGLTPYEIFVGDLYETIKIMQFINKVKPNV